MARTHDTNWILNNVYNSDGSFTIREDSNNIINAVYDEDSNAIKVRLVNASGSVSVGTPTIVSSSIYTVQTSDSLLHVTATSTNSCSILIPADQLSTNRKLIIKDAALSCSLNTLTVSSSGLIDLQQTFTFEEDGQAINLYEQGGNLFVY